MDDHDIEDLKAMVADCKKRMHSLSDWEFNLVDNIKYRLDNGIYITRKQAEHLEKLWERIT